VVAAIGRVYFTSPETGLPSLALKGRRIEKWPNDQHRALQFNLRSKAAHLLNDPATGRSSRNWMASLLPGSKFTGLLEHVTMIPRSGGTRLPLVQ